MENHNELFIRKPEIEYYEKRSFRFANHEREHVVLVIPNRGWAHRVASLFRIIPEKTKVELDEIGSYIWNQMDGTHTVEEIAKMAYHKFGERMEPLFPRLLQYLSWMNRLGYIAKKAK